MAPHLQQRLQQHHLDHPAAFKPETRALLLVVMVTTRWDREGESYPVFGDPRAG